MQIYQLILVVIIFTNIIAEDEEPASSKIKVQKLDVQTQNLVNAMAKALINIMQCENKKIAIFRKAKHEDKYFIETKELSAQLNDSETKSLCMVNLIKKIEKVKKENKAEDKKIIENLLKNHNLLPITIIDHDKILKKEFDELKKILTVEVEYAEEEEEHKGEHDQNVEEHREKYKKFANALIKGFDSMKDEKCKEDGKMLIKRNEGNNFEMNADKLIQYIKMAKDTNKIGESVNLGNDMPTVKICSINVEMADGDIKKWNLESTGGWVTISHGVHGKKIKFESIEKMLKEFKRYDQPEKKLETMAVIEQNDTM